MKSYELKGETTYLDNLVPKEKVKEYEQEEHRHRQYLAKSVSIDRSNLDHDAVNYIFEECDNMFSLSDFCNTVYELLEEAKDARDKGDIHAEIEILETLNYLYELNKEGEIEC